MNLNQEIVIARFSVYEGRYWNAPTCTILIKANANFIIGRDPSASLYAFNDCYLSKQHLHIHTVIFEEDNFTGIPPLVYARDLSTYGTSFRHPSEAEEPSYRRLSMAKADEQRALLLTHGDELILTPEFRLVFEQLNQRHSIANSSSSGLDSVQSMEQTLFKDNYLLSNRVLGQGGHGVVYMAIHKRTQHQLACKVVDLRTVRHIEDEKDKPHSTTSSLRRYLREFNVLKGLSHPNIIQLEKVFQTPHTLYIFQELVTGGDLFSFIEAKGGEGVNDAEAAVIMRQILKAVEYLHDRHIVHRDLKPDNILLTSTSIHARVIVADFDAARFVPIEGNDKLRRSRMLTSVGTLEYVAPEVYGKNYTVGSKKGYSTAVDMWSVGCIAAMLLTGDVVFIDRENPEYHTKPKDVILRLAAECNLAVLDAGWAWRKVGKRPKDFVKNLLVLDEQKRMTAREALQHSWLSRKLHAKFLDELYKRAVGSWKPREEVCNLVERVQLRQVYPQTQEMAPPPSLQSIWRDDEEERRLIHGMTLPVRPDLHDSRKDQSDLMDTQDDETEDVAQIRTGFSKYNYHVTDEGCATRQILPSTLDSPLTGPSPQLR